jgi:alkylhydroperoxidase family enzyme
MRAATLAQELESSTVDFAQLHEDYAPVLKLVNELIGVIPNCDPYLEIWPIGFRTYNLLVPNMLNLPAALLGQGAPKDLVGLAMYVASRSAGCMYCSAHTCAFALRRGAAPRMIVGEYSTEVEAAVASVAYSLGKAPSDITQDQVRELERHLSPEDVEWVVLAVAMMGFLNKFMDAMGIELESESIAAVQDLIGPTGWTTGKHQWRDDLEIESDGDVPVDSWRTYLRVFRQAPKAIRLEGKWTKGVSGRIGPALLMLEEQVGYSFPIFGSLHHKRPVKAVATVLRDNLNPELSEIGLPAKIMAGLIYAKMADNEMLQAEMVQLAELLAPDVDPELLVDVARFATAANEDMSIPEGLSKVDASAILLAKAASPSPSAINEITISTVTEQLTPAQIIELVVWLSVCQLLHRLYSFYDARIGLA